MSEEPEKGAVRPQIFGRYCLLERLSIGGMAEIYKARPFCAESPRDYLVVKRILPHFADDREFIAMFVDEARITIQLNHPNICQLYELGQLNGAYYIVMEYIAGRDVLALINWFRTRHLKLTIELVVAIIADVCAGLDYAHHKVDANGQPLRVVHRDISPQNVIVGYDGSVKVIDFGIARAASRYQRTEQGILKGKFGYMSPEQVQVKAIDYRSDIFATGTLLWEMLAAQRLFHAKNEIDIIENVKAKVVPPVSSVHPDADEALDAIVAKALERNVEARYQRAGLMEADLREWLAKRDPSYGPAQIAAWMRSAWADRLADEESLNRTSDAFMRPRDVALWGFQQEDPAPEALKAFENISVQSEDEIARLETQVIADRGEVLVENPTRVGAPALPGQDSSLSRRRAARAWIAALITTLALLAILGMFFAFSSGSFSGARATGARLQLVTPFYEDAHVEIDGNSLESTLKPDGSLFWRADFVAPGSHRLRIVAGGHEVYDEMHFFQAGEAQELAIELVEILPEIREIRVSVPDSVQGLKILVNGRLRSLHEEIVVPLRLEESFLVEAAAPGYLPLRTRIDRSQRSDVYALQLQPIGARLELDTDPPAIVHVDGDARGHTGEGGLALLGLDPWGVQKIEVEAIDQGFMRHEELFAFDGVFQRKKHIQLPRIGQRIGESRGFGEVRFVGDVFYLVEVDGRAPYFATGLGARELGLSAGRHEIRLLRGEGEPAEFVVDIVSGKTETIRLPSYRERED